MDLKTAIEDIRDKLAGIPGVKTCAIGIEATLNPDDYPIVRVVPTSIKPVPGQSWVRSVEVTVVFGNLIHEFGAGGLKAVYTSLLDLEAAILTAPRIGNGYGIRHRETYTDEDQLEGHKMMAARFAFDVRIGVSVRLGPSCARVSR